MFLDLGFQFAESHFATGAFVFSGAGGVNGSGRQGKIQGAGMLFFVGVYGEDAVELHQVGRIRFE